MSRPEVSFHTQGRRLQHRGSYIIIDQAYVQYIPPATGSSSTSTTPPILFIHGGGLTGAMWESTPDRRPGWAILACRSPFNRPVYCIDAVDSGRSQRCPDDFRPFPVEHRTAAEIHARFRISSLGRSTSEFANTDHEGTNDAYQFPIEHESRFVAAQSARRRGQAQYDAESRGIQDAISEIGECDVVAHSNGAATCIAALLDDVTRAKVRRLVLIEPGPPVTESLTHLNGVTTLVVWADYLENHQLWDQIVRHYSLLDGFSTIMNLPELGIKGNSHFPMLDRNSDEVGQLLLNWLQQA